MSTLVLPRLGLYVALGDEERVGTSQTFLSTYELGSARTHGVMVPALAQGLTVSADEVLGLKEPSENGLTKDHRSLHRLEQIERCTRRKGTALTTVDAFRMQP